MAKVTILVADDSPTELKLVVSALQGKGYHVLTAVDGEDAIDKVTKERPNLAILDVVMPKKNGFQVCRHLKNAAETKDIPILLLTSKNQESDKFWGFKQGADAYLTKPFNEETLCGQVRQMV